MKTKDHLGLIERLRKTASTLNSCGYDYLTYAILEAAQALSEQEGTDMVSQSQSCGERAAPTEAEPAGEEFLEFKEALDDVRGLRAEYECLNGGGPGWTERNKAAWARVDELFANEDEAAWNRRSLPTSGLSLREGEP